MPLSCYHKYSWQWGMTLHRKSIGSDGLTWLQKAGVEESVIKTVWLNALTSPRNAVKIPHVDKFISFLSHSSSQELRATQDCVASLPPFQPHNNSESYICLFFMGWAVSWTSRLLNPSLSFYMDTKVRLSLTELKHQEIISYHLMSYAFLQPLELLGWGGQFSHSSWSHWWSLNWSYITEYFSVKGQDWSCMNIS